MFLDFNLLLTQVEELGRAAGVLVGEVRAPCNVCDPKLSVEADIALKAVVTSLATCCMFVGIIATGYHVLVGLLVWTRVACAIGHKKVDSIRHIVFLAVKGLLCWLGSLWCRESAAMRPPLV